MKTERRQAGGSSRTPWSANENSPLSLGVCYRWQEQPNSPGGSQDIAAGSSRAKGLLPNFQWEERHLTSVSWPKKGTLGLFTGDLEEEEGVKRKKKKKAQPDHASKTSGASTAFLRAVPPQRQERLTLKAIKYLGYFRITPWPPGISY